MGNCLLSFENYIYDADCAVNSHGSEVSGLSAAQLKDPQIRRRWRTPVGTVTPIVDFDFGVTKGVDIVAFQQPVDAGGLNKKGQASGYISSSDQVRHKFSVVAEGGADVYDTGSVNSNIKSGFGIHVTKLPTTKNARWWSLILNAASLTGGVNYIDIGVAWAGAVFTPKRNMQYGYNWAFVDSSSINTVETSGLDFVRQGFKRRNIVFSFDSLDDADAEIISNMQRLVGTSQQVLFVPDPDDVTSDFAQPIIGRLTDTNPTALPSFQTYTKSFSLLQSI